MVSVGGVNKSNFHLAKTGVTSGKYNSLDVKYRKWDEMKEMMLM